MLKGATVGCGFFSRIQMESWKRVKGAKIVAVCDLDEAKARAFAADFGSKPYTDVDQMLETEKPDFLDIATRPASHLPLVRKAAVAGIPALCQKPMADTWEEACRITRVARRANIRLMMNENWRWQAWYRRIKSLLEEDRIGEPFYYHIATRQRDGLGEQPYPNQPYFKEMPRLFVIETIVHHIDTARFLFGDIEEVYCQTGKLNPVLRAEDFAILTLRHVGGVCGVIDGNRVTEPDEAGPAMEVARFEGFDNKIHLRHSGEVRLGDESVLSADGGRGYRGDSCRATQQHFVDCLAENRQFETEAGDYLKRTVAVVEACYLSAAEDRVVKVSEFSASVGGV
jgi:predicted dehydrogenase